MDGVPRRDLLITYEVRGEMMSTSGILELVASRLPFFLGEIGIGYQGRNLAMCLVILT